MFGRLFGSKEKTEPSNGGKLTTGISNAINAAVGSKSIPSMPGAAQKAFKLSIDPNAEARDFIEVIESDEALSARVLKIANSVFFDRGKPSQTIEEAVLVIGINELRCLLNATSLSDIFPSKHPARAQFWANDVATALIAKNLATRLIPAKAELAFLAGLMHDVGKLLLLQRLPENYQTVLHMVAEKGVDFCEAEVDLFPFDHTQVGQLIGEKWNFSSELNTIIRRHHDNWSALSRNSTGETLVCIVKAADIFSHALGLGHGKGFSKFKVKMSNECDEAFAALGIPLSEKQASFERFQRTFEVEFDLYAGNTGK